MDEFEKPQLLGGKGAWNLAYHRLGAIEHQGFLRIQRNQGALWGGKACGVKHAVVEVFDFVIPPSVPAVILRKDHMVQHGS
jgi:hypothetical protein